MTNHDHAVATNGPLISSSLSHDQLSKWRNGNEDIAEISNEWIIGEIFWRKAIGRPNTLTLSAAFSISAWTDTDPQAEDSPLPYKPRLVELWDAKDDGEFWRVAFRVLAVE